jgi:hypothetical protein
MYRTAAPQHDVRDEAAFTVGGLGVAPSWASGGRRQDMVNI